MRRRGPFPALASAALALALAAPGLAAERDTYRIDPGGQVRAVRAIDVDGDGRLDLVVLLQETADDADTVLVLRTPAVPVARRFSPADHVVRIPCVGPLADAGAVAVGRFGPGGEVRLRFLGPRGILERAPDGTSPQAAEGADERLGHPTLFGRSAGRALVFWDGLADLDGDGLDELWFPLARDNGPLQVLGGRPAADRLLALEPTNAGSSDAVNLLGRTAFIPNLFPADLDGDGRRELVALQATSLVAWAVAGAAPGAASGAPAFRLPLPFLEADSSRGPEEVRTARLQLADVDGDGVADLLVTLITGQRTRLESMRTILFHYPGPFRDPASGALVAPRARIDTESIVLHPTFVDLDGDGDLEYVGDSIRGGRLDMIARILGKDPEITYVAFRFDQRTGTFEDTPWFSAARTYPASEALSNRFGRSAFLDGDFDGDGRRDLLDLGDLKGVEVLRIAPRAGDPAGEGVAFGEVLVPRIPVAEGLTAGAQVGDLNGDGRADAILWSATALFLLVSRRGS